MAVPVWTTALPDWEERLLSGSSLVPCPPLFPDYAARALSVFKELKIVDAPGQPKMGDVARPWVFDFVSAIFGSYDSETGRQAIREFLLLVSKKNAKSTIAAGIMLTAIILNWRHSAELFILSPTKEIANNSFIPARDMIAADDVLRDLFHVQEHLRVITHRKTKATLKVIAADNETVGGKKGSFVLVDEMWLFGKQQKAESMLREALGGRASRPEGFTVYLSTHSDEQPVGVWKQTLNDYRDIRDGKLVDPKRMGILYEFPQRMIDSGEYKDRKNFYITNPNLGASVDPEFLDEEYTKAERNGAVSFAGFAAKHLNVEIGLGLRSDGWIGAEYWNAAAEPDVDLNFILTNSEVVVAGVDGGGLDDMLGLAVLGREAGNGRWMLWTHAWVHKIALERRKGEVSKWKDLETAGDLTVVENLGEDIEQIIEIVKRIEVANLFPEKNAIGLDQVGIGQLPNQLALDGFEHPRVVAITQGWKLSGAIKTAERELASMNLVHGGQPLMDYAVTNAKVEPKGNAVLVTKQVSGAAKIDPLMAMFNCIALMNMNPTSAKKEYQAFFLNVA
jgi:phage terminase large subunit-like protein